MDVESSSELEVVDGSSQDGPRWQPRSGPSYKPQSRPGFLAIADAPRDPPRSSSSSPTTDPTLTPNGPRRTAIGEHNLSPTERFDITSDARSAKQSTVSGAEFVGTPGEQYTVGGGPNSQSREITHEPSHEDPMWTPDAQKTAAQLALRDIMASKMVGRTRAQ